MANLVKSMWRRKPETAVERSFPALSMADWAQQWFGFNGFSYPVAGDCEMPANFQGYVEDAYKSNGVVFACMLVRMLLFSEARLQYRKVVKGRPGELFGTQDLALLERPWPNATTGDLLSRMIQDADLAG